MTDPSYYDEVTSLIMEHYSTMEAGFSVAPPTEVGEQDLEARYGTLGREELLQRFRHLSLLLTVLSALYCLDHTPSFNSQEAGKERTDQLLNPRPRRVLDAAVTLLVRDKESVAGMSYDLENGPSKPSSSVLVLKDADRDSGNAVGEADDSGDSGQDDGSDFGDTVGEDNSLSNTLDRDLEVEDVPNLEGEGIPSYDLGQWVVNVTATTNPMQIAGEDNPNQSRAAKQKKEDLDNSFGLPTLCDRGDSYWPTLSNSEAFE